MIPLHVNSRVTRCRSLVMLHLCVMICMIMTGISQASAAVDAWLDTNSISMGETVQLTVKMDGKTNETPDITPIQKHFKILDSSSSSSVNIVNGSISYSTTWFYQLSPRESGKLRIPPLKVGNGHTPELFVDVTDSKKPGSDTDRDIFIETRCTPHDPFVQQQVSCTVKLFSALNITEGSMSAPETRNVVVRQTGKDRDYHAVRNSRRYRIIERRYVLFPQESGEITISPPVFSGTVATGVRSGDPFSSFMGRDPFFSRGLPGLGQAARHVHISGKAVTLKVKPRPLEDRSRYWLPAASVTLSEQWKPDTVEIHQGDTVTRTITITARGLTGEQLPDLIPASFPGVRTYQDRPEVSTMDNKNGVTGKKILEIAFVPEKPGTIMLPSIELQWWNTKSGKPESVSLPARKITVLPLAGSRRPHASGAIPADTGEKTATARQTLKNPLKKTWTPAAVKNRNTDKKPWQWIAVGLGAAWFLTLYLLWREKKKNHARGRIRIPSEPAGHSNSRGYKKLFRAECMSNNAGGAREALLKWAATIWHENPPAGLWELAARIPDAEAAEELRQLEKILYGKNPEKWENGPRLASLLQKLPEPQGHDGRETMNTPLPPLYHCQGPVQK